MTLGQKRALAQEWVVYPQLEVLLVPLMMRISSTIKKTKTRKTMPTQIRIRWILSKMKKRMVLTRKMMKKMKSLITNLVEAAPPMYPENKK